MFITGHVTRRMRIDRNWYGDGRFNPQYLRSDNRQARDIVLEAVAFARGSLQAANCMFFSWLWALSRLPAASVLP